MPVPALPVLELPSRTVMLTTVGFTLATIWAGLSRLADGTGLAAVRSAWIGTLTCGPCAAGWPFLPTGWALNTKRNAPSPSSGARLNEQQADEQAAGGAELAGLRRSGDRRDRRVPGGYPGGYPRHCGGRGYGTGSSQAGTAVTG